ncbi:MAG: V-type ATPase subunit [Planctomycetes bacterium]|nr:V-type ATPase subunit [Planctomycetota bacterium]
MAELIKKDVIDFYTYPPVGSDDWRYAFETAVIRAIETQMLGKATFLDMSNAENFEAAVDSLGASEYASLQGKSFSELEEILHIRRSDVREQFFDLMIDKEIAELFKSRNDFANLRLVLRRSLTGKALGNDYSKEGNVTVEKLVKVFEAEAEADSDTSELPDYMREASDEAVLAYYQKKDIRQIDYAIDKSQAEYNLRRAKQLRSVFLSGLFRIQIDLTNIRTMLRLKYTESEKRNAFLDGGYIGFERLREGLDSDYETMGQLFFVTPHHRIVDTGANYLVSDKSFLRLEQQCEEYLMGFLKTAIQITAGPQPIVAYLLMKENEIRTVRLILTAKKNGLDTKLILDRLGA